MPLGREITVVRDDVQASLHIDAVLSLRWAEASISGLVGEHRASTRPASRRLEGSDSHQ
jgi:hypothetical protein